MAQMPHDGVVEDGRVYTTVALARIFGVKGHDTVERWLLDLNCPAVRVGSRTLVSGQEFRRSVERKPGVITS